MLFNLDFTNNTIFYLLSKPVIPIGIPSKDVKAGIEIYLLIEEANIRKCSV